MRVLVAIASICCGDYGTVARYAPEVIESAGAALDRLKADASASRLILVGYSGGRALAALLAERHRDVAALVPGQDHGCCWATHWPMLATSAEFSRIEG